MMMATKTMTQVAEKAGSQGAKEVGYQLRTPIDLEVCPEATW
jgi:hypothetical protein